jgi:uncharacterized protein YcaQ
MIVEITKGSTIHRKFDTESEVLPRIGERVYINGITYKVWDIIHLYDFNRIEVYVKIAKRQYIM